jgi:multidrug resistance efflux pump
VAKAELDLANTVVIAPAQGLITDLKADVGAYAGAGQPVMTLIAIHDLWVDAAFTENNLGHIRRGSEASLVFDSLPGRVFSGEVRSVGLGVSAGREPPPGSLPQISNDRDWLRQAQRFPVEVGFDLEQAPELQEQLRLGGQVSVMVYSEDATVLRWLGALYLRILSYLSYAY